MKRRWGLLLLAVVVLVGLALWLRMSRKPLPTTTLTDGSRFTVQGVTVSRSPTWCFGNLLQKLGAKVPGRLGDKLSSNTRMKTGDQGQPVLAIWFSVERQGSLTLPAQFEARLKETNCATLRNFARVRQMPPRVEGVFLVSVWPRRFNEITMELRNFPVGGSLGEIRVPIPASQAPQWVAETLPSTRHTNGLKVTLNLVTVRQPDSDPLAELASGQRGWADGPATRATLSLDIVETNRPADSWKAARVVLVDATGNRSEVAMYPVPSSRSDPLNLHQLMGWPAMPGEAAVKLQVECMKTSQFKPEEIVTVRVVSAAGGSEFGTNLPSGHLTVLRMGDQLMVMPPNALGPPVTNFHSARRYVLLAATDDEGRDFPVRQESCATVERGLTTVNLRLAIAPVHWVEWIVPAAGTWTNSGVR